MDAITSREGRVPFAVTDPNYLKVERYTSDVFYNLELDRMWQRTWQMACRVEDIPKVGNYIEYTIGDQSILVVRSGPGDDEITAYENACRHRGRQLANGVGSFRGGKIVCRFHGWTWDLEGETDAIFGKEEGFEPSCVLKPDTDLVKVNSAIWAGMVFVNLDEDPVSFEEFVKPLAEAINGLRVEDMKPIWWQQIEVDANWKLTIEAFVEGYHVCYTHPQMIVGAKPHPGMPDTNSLHLLDNGHTYFRPKQDGARFLEQEWSDERKDIDTFERVVSTLRTLTPILAEDIEVIETNRGKPVPEGSTVEREAFAAIYADAAKRGVELPSPDLARTWGGVYHGFPNIVIYPFFSNCWLMRSRPISAEKTIVDLWMLRLPEPGQKPVKPVRQGPFRPDDTDHISLITVQDFGNLEPVQRGMHARHLPEIRLSQRWEGIISHRHLEIDRYIASD